MLTLTLTNFRGFKQKQFRFNKSLVLINGNSGSGKTTIFMAIIFALTGEGKKLPNYNHKSCSVRLEYTPNTLNIRSQRSDQQTTQENKNAEERTTPSAARHNGLFIITRTKQPNRLLLHYKDRVYEDKEAQSIINKIYPKYNLGYMSQRTHKAFILMNPTDKLRFIEDLAFGEEKVESLHKNCRNLVKQRKEELLLTQTQRSTIIETLTGMNIKKIEQPQVATQARSEFYPFYGSQTKAILPTQGCDYEAAQTTTVECIEKKTGCANASESKKNVKNQTSPNTQTKTYIKKEEEYVNEITEIEQNILDISTKLNKITSFIELKTELEQDLDEIPIIKESLDDLENELSELTKQYQQWNMYNREKKKLNLQQPSGFSNEEINIMIEDMELLIELSCELYLLDDIEEKLVSIKKKIKNTVFPLLCPKCNKQVYLHGDKLIIPNIETNIGGTSKNPAVSYETLKTQEKTKYTLECKQSLLLDNKSKYKKKMSEYPELDNPSNQLQLLNKMKSDDEKYTKQLALCNSLQVNKPTHPEIYCKQLALSKEQKITRQEKEKCLLSLITRANLTDYFPKKAINIPNVKIDSSIIEQEKKNLEKQLSKLNTDLPIVKNHQEFSKSVHQWNKVTLLSETEKKLNISYPRAVKLQNIIKEAEKLAVEEVISQINLHAQIYLDHMFSGNLQVTLVFDSLKLNVVVFHDQHESDINNLSGGELARVILAYTIAIAEINNIKLLLLDECMASLDQETSNLVINTIKQNFSGDIFCIAHQTTKGIFEEVVEL